jgi:hypothetical protein
MPADFDVEDDFLLVDDLEDVSWLRQTADGEFEAAVTGKGYKQTPRRKTAALVENVDCIWHLHRPDFAGASISAGDRLLRVADESQWVVVYSDENGYEDQLRVGTTRAIL